MIVCAGSAVMADRVLISGRLLKTCSSPRNGASDSRVCLGVRWSAVISVGLSAEPHAQGQFGVRAAAHGNQHVLNLIGQRAAHQGHITRRACQYFGGRDVQRVELARPVQQQQVRFVGGNRFRQDRPTDDARRGLGLCSVPARRRSTRAAGAAPAALHTRPR